TKQKVRKVFSLYKTVLGNKMCLPESEMIDYIIDEIENRNLQISETSDLMFVDRSWPCLHCSDFVWVSPYSISRYDVAKVLDFLLKYVALLWAQFEIHKFFLLLKHPIFTIFYDFLQFTRNWRNNSLEFELHMAYDNVECNVRKNGLGRYVNDVVIQHHDKIVTSSDLGLAVTCQYDLTNKSVTNEVDLGVHGDIQPALSEEVTVDSPNVAMKITDRNGGDVMPTAEVGDPLALRFEIIDKNSPYEIFVRDLVAMDGVDSSEIVLIDSFGCPTDHFIMGPIYKSIDSGKILLSHFDAFKFPSSEVVQFRALVTPCMPVCEPIQCDQEEESTGDLRSVISYGKRRRRRSTSETNDDMILVQSIQITDKFGFERDMNNSRSVGSEAVYIPSNEPGLCVNMAGLIVAGTVFLAAQLAVIAVWTFIWQRRRIGHKLHSDAMSVSVSLPSGLSGNRTDSLYTDHEISDDEDTEEPEQEDNNFFGKDGTQLRKEPFPMSKTRPPNILMKLPGVVGQAAKNAKTEIA
ncbi:hypothetical protein RN001_004530, partial [Aquatica leii]